MLMTEYKRRALLALARLILIQAHEASGRMAGSLGRSGLRSVINSAAASGKIIEMAECQRNQ